MPVIVTPPREMFPNTHCPFAYLIHVQTHWPKSWLFVMQFIFLILVPCVHCNTDEPNLFSFMRGTKIPCYLTPSLPNKCMSTVSSQIAPLIYDRTAEISGMPISYSWKAKCQNRKQGFWPNVCEESGWVSARSKHWESSYYTEPIITCEYLYFVGTQAKLY